MCLQGSVPEDLHQGLQNRNLTLHYVFNAVALTLHTLW